METTEDNQKIKRGIDRGKTAADFGYWTSNGPSLFASCAAGAHINPQKYKRTDMTTKRFTGLSPFEKQLSS
jgi:hypothetical protein